MMERKVKVSLQKLDAVVHDFKRVRSIMQDQYTNLNRLLSVLDQELTDLQASMDIKKRRKA